MHESSPQIVETAEHALQVHTDPVVGVPPSAPPRALLWALAVAAALGIAGYGFWRTAHPTARVPLAVAAEAAQAAGAAVERSGISVEWRDGAAWVLPQDAARAGAVAAEACRQVQEVHPVAAAVNEESVFLSSEASHARRLAATMTTLEQMIQAQSGVARARVVLAEALRPGAPGSAYSGATAAATVTTTTGEMSQDLVDSVTALVCGALPGLTPERVAVIDARANRHRTARTPDARRADDARRERERALVHRLTTAVPGASQARVAVHMEESGAVTASLSFDYEYGRSLVRRSAGQDPEAAIAAEEGRVEFMAQTLLCDAAAEGDVRVAVSVARAPDDAMGAASATRSELPVRAEIPSALPAVGSAVDAQVARERSTLLGPSSSAQRGWDAGTFALVGLGLCAVVGAAFVASRSTARNARAAAAGAALATAAAADALDPPASDDPLATSAADEYDTEAAADAVRADPTLAAAVLRTWFDADMDARAAHVVVALDSESAGALLRAMPVSLVNRVTGALGHLQTPTSAELADASQALVEEMLLTREAAHDEAHGDERDHLVGAASSEEGV